MTMTPMSSAATSFGVSKMLKLIQGIPAKAGIAFCVVVVLAMALVSGCAMSGGGYEGHYINDALPEGAQLFKAEAGDYSDKRVAEGTESNEIFPLDWNVFDHSVPCSAIKAVHYWASGVDKDEAGLRLVGHIYGGEYFPRPASGIHWLSPELWIE
ncbi:MAG: hypothetical protein ACR2QC_10945, partial [Gammaproteobacteria bacterium]